MFNKIEKVILDKTGYSYQDLLDIEQKEYSIDNLDKAVEIIKSAIECGVPITVVGDYDCDGICASAIFRTTLTSLGIDIKVRLPKRFSEGYGLSEKIIDEIDSGLVITVDNGIAAKQAIQKAKDKGLTVLVTDHHLAPADGVPDVADLIIDPNAIPDSATFNGYCGAGLALKICEKLTNNQRVLNKISILGAIATVADSVPMLEDNRNIVKKGLRLLNEGLNVPLALQELISIKDLINITEKDIGFAIGPCINAQGRLNDDGADTSLSFLTFVGNSEASEEVARNMLSCNELRKALTEDAMAELNNQLIDDGALFDKVIVLQNNNVSEGLVGLCAGKLAEEQKKPILVFGPFENGICKGSCRTVKGAHLKNILDEVNSKIPHAIVKYGGHEMAAGISVYEEYFDEFKEVINTVNFEIEDVSNVADIEITEEEIPFAIEELRKFAPFGEGFPEIVFNVKDFVAAPQYGSHYAVLKEKHLKFLGNGTEALWFGALEKYQDMEEPVKFDAIGTLSVNYFNGKETPSIEIRDIIPKLATTNTSLQDLLLRASEMR